MVVLAMIGIVMVTTIKNRRVRHVRIVLCLKTAAAKHTTHNYLNGHAKKENTKEKNNGYRNFTSNNSKNLC